MDSKDKLAAAAAIVVFSLLLSPTLSSACGSCNPRPPVSPNKPPVAASPPPATASCPINTSKFGVCAALLGANVVVGSPPYSQCCAVLGGLGELEAAWCICTALKANVLGIELNLPIDVELILSLCKRPIPPGYKCASS